MGLNATHPLYTATVDDQVLMRDCYAGERAVKDKDVLYLPPTPGMKLDGMNSNAEGKGDGRAAYDTYKLRAVFPDVVSDAVENLLGMLHCKPSKIEVPAQMEPLLESLTSDGASAVELLRRINEQQLVTGRLGLLVDLPTNPDQSNPLPFIATYMTEAIRNWDDNDGEEGKESLQFVILDESGFERAGGEFEWKKVEKYRLLQMGNGAGEDTGKYYQALYKSKDFDPTQLKSPMIMGKAMDEIPFVFINTKDLKAAPDNPPLLGLATLAMAIYRGDADYRQCLFLQGQDTLVVIGGTNAADEATRVGAGAKIDVELHGDAKYIGVSSQGLPEMRASLENDMKRAAQKTGQLVSAMGNQKESGEALNTRLKAQTATLKQIALTGAEGLQTVLRMIARWKNLDESKVIVTPNLEFADVTINAKDLVDMMTSKRMGAPLSMESIHAFMYDRGLTKKTLEEELAAIDDEPPLELGPAPAAPGTPPQNQPGAKEGDEE